MHERHTMYIQNNPATNNIRTKEQSIGLMGMLS